MNEKGECLVSIKASDIFRIYHISRLNVFKLIASDDLKDRLLFSWIDQRLDDVKNWKGELEVKRSELEKEVDATETYLVRIEKRLQSLQENLHLAQTTLANR